MKRLTIHLKRVEPIKNKVFNTVSHKVSSDKDIASYLKDNEGNINKFYVSNL